MEPEGSFFHKILSPDPNLNQIDPVCVLTLFHLTAIKNSHAIEKRMSINELVKYIHK
jgi:hypothetical protein